MERLLKKLFEKSIEVGTVEYTKEEVNSNWIGASPTSIETIHKIEEKLKISFPQDYKDLLLIANGFKMSNDGVEPSFIEIEEVDYLKNIEPFIIECYEDTLAELEESILIGGKREEQKFLLIPPSNDKENWRYWKFANWIPGIHEYKNLEHYLKDVINFIEGKQN